MTGRGAPRVRLAIRRSAGALVALGTVCAATPLVAQGRTQGSSRGSAQATTPQTACRGEGGSVTIQTPRPVVQEWPAPLDRAVTIVDDEVTLRDGLARLASAAGVRLSYVAEWLPLDRVLCLSYRTVPAGQVLADLLRGTEVEAVVAGADQVVLAPAHRATLTTDGSIGDVASRASLLDRVVVIGSVGAEPERSSPVSVGVISGDRLAGLETASLTRILDGAVPGVWMWQQSPTTFAARYGSMRGATSFGLSYPKIYIDGIEVANPLLVRQFDATTIERVEVIRGPQGAALYGADAISGVINIVTRHDGAGPTGRRVGLSSTAGISGSVYAPQGVLTQQHALTLRGGTADRSGGVGLNIGSLGAYIPGAFARTIAANGDFRLVGARSVLIGTARFLNERAGTPANPLLSAFGQQPGGSITSPRTQVPADRPDKPQPGGGASRTTDDARMEGGRWDGRPRSSGIGAPLAPASPLGRDTAATQAVSQYTVGSTLSFVPNERWSYQFVLGVDGYRLRNPARDDGPIPSAVDSALDAARGGSDRLTARVSSTARFGLPEQVSAALVFTAEHSVAREQSAIVVGGVTTERTASTAGGFDRGGNVTSALEPQARLVGWRGNTGLVAQANAALRNRLFATAGLRLERNDALLGATRITTLPMLGGAVVADRGDVTFKMRAAYGKSIRPVQGAIRELAWSGRRTALVAYDLAPEEQAGIEAGADLFVGRTLGFHVTRFDQHASGLIQSVAVSVPTTSRPPRSSEAATSLIGYQLQNVGEIGNSGWELEGSAALGHLTLGATLSLVDSRVRRLADDYTGDLRAGDRMLEVPARTASLTGSWNGRGWLGSLTIARASAWTGYDRLALASALTSGKVVARDLVGDRLRGYWREYDGVPRLRASFSRDLFRGLSLVMTGDNLLGQQRGEPDNVTVVPGRTVTAGLKASF